MHLPGVSLWGAGGRPWPPVVEAMCTGTAGNTYAAMTALALALALAQHLCPAAATFSVGTEQLRFAEEGGVGPQCGSDTSVAALATLGNTSGDGVSDSVGRNVGNGNDDGVGE